MTVADPGKITGVATTRGPVSGHPAVEDRERRGTGTVQNTMRVYQVILSGRQTDCILQLKKYGGVIVHRINWCTEL